jgi:general secretion pathway protein L
MAASGKDMLLIHAAGPRWAWRVIDRAGRVQRRGECAPGQPDWPTDKTIVVLADAAWAMGLKLDLPELPPARLKQALRWAAEEHLASNAEDEHVVAGPRGAEGLLHCVVIGNARMHELLAAFPDQAVEIVIPDALCLPWQPGQVSLAERGGRVLVRWDDWAFGSFEEAFLAELIDSLDSAGTRWRWFGGKVPDALAGHAMETAGEDALSALAPAALAPVVNLQSGPFAPGSARQAEGWWRWAAGLAAAVLVLALAGAGAEYLMLKRQSESLRSELDARFLEAFPNVGRVVPGRERELAERELARLRFGESAGLLELMSRVAPMIEAQGGLRLDGLSYRDGQLELNLRAPDVPALDQLEQRLRGMGLRADLQSASVDGDGASGRVRVGMGAAAGQGSR